ncbi:MAG TPA: uroporphyrinogen-III C-methyltransferase [Nitrososphaerales archaeon]|nr:uroporphyrinogen-III C-methyltransferase [Nitrososphaerales archaeon]
MPRRRRGKGKVSLVGAGPGDPGLLTLKGLLRLREADVVIYDRLVSKEVIALIPHGVVKTYGGKDPGSKGREKQDELNDLILSEAKSGKKVVRLKGGDPFLFSRGGEEAEFLRRHRVEFEVVPGVSSALAVPAYAGIPLTHRGYASSVTVVTGREAGMKSKLDWSKIAGGSDVLVVLMGAAKVEEISTKLLEAGKPADTPLAAITWGTTARQRTVTTTLSRAAKGEGGVDKVEAPCVIVVGRVVALAPRLRWLAEGGPSALGAASGSPESRRGSSTPRSRLPRT